MTSMIECINCKLKCRHRDLLVNPCPVCGCTDFREVPKEGNIKGKLGGK